MKKVNWGWVQAMCFVGAIVVLNLPSAPADAAHARASLLFRSVVAGALGVGMVVAYRLRSRQPVAATAIDSGVPALPPEARAITVTYRNTLQAARRCELYTLFNRPPGLLVFAFFGLCGALLAAGQVARFNRPMALIAFPVLHLLAFGAFLAYIAFILSVALKAKFPRPDSVRLCTSSLTADGFQDVTPEKVIPMPWARIRSIREVDGDIFFSLNVNGCYIPREAFPSLDEARRYHRAAVALWRSRGRDWPDDVPAVIDETRSTAPAPAVDDPNPYAAPRAPLYPGLESTGASRYTVLIRWTVAILVLEYLAILPLVLANSTNRGRVPVAARAIGPPAGSRGG